MSHAPLVTPAAANGHLPPHKAPNETKPDGTQTNPLRISNKMPKAHTYIISCHSLTSVANCALPGLTREPPWGSLDAGAPITTAPQNLQCGTVSHQPPRAMLDAGQATGGDGGPHVEASGQPMRIHGPSERKDISARPRCRCRSVTFQPSPAHARRGEAGSEVGSEASWRGASLSLKAAPRTERHDMPVPE